MAGVELQVQVQRGIDSALRQQKEMSKCSETADKAVDKLRGVQVVEKYKMCLRIEFVVLCAVIVVIWGLLSIPVILYHIPLVC